jgi:hypothetical protein
MGHVQSEPQVKRTSSTRRCKFFRIQLSAIRIQGVASAGSPGAPPESLYIDSVVD